ncbi:MAG: PHP domain-containing protein, partial [Candidatus Omnitrophica bacterium]|nr:PHP domain-containing protein [Candidatus Omnitrophota bacterium]
AQKRGYAYIALTDHSQSLKIAGGVSVADLKKKKKEIDGANRKLKKTRILFGTEVDIDSGGNLDYPDKVLAGFDIVVAAIHGGFKQPKEKITARLVKACRHKHVHIIAHPTGRLWGVRPAYDFDFDKVARAAAETNTVLEINAYPQRLDLNDMHARRARACGARMAVSTDAHLAQQLDNMEFGLAVARRAWLGKADVVNCLPPDKLLKGLKQ